MRCIDNGITYGLDPKGCMWCHTFLEEIFGSTSKPPNDIYNDINILETDGG